MDMTVREEELASDVPEVHIVAGVTPADVETLLNMAAASGLFESDALMSAEDMAWDTAYGDGSEPHTFLLAVLHESGKTRPVGFLCFDLIPHWPDSFELVGITVDPEFQRMGIGSALISEMTRQVAARQGKRILLETGLDRSFEHARRFYEANEFTQEHRFLKQFIPNQGGVIYRLNLDPENTDHQYQ